jgi:hypothetical protein
LACGDGQFGLTYFQRVNADKVLITVNQGYVNYFGNNFIAAKKEFGEARAAGPPNADMGLEYAGEFGAHPTDPLVTTERPTPEKKTQWPLNPKT